MSAKIKVSVHQLHAIPRRPTVTTVSLRSQPGHARGEHRDRKLEQADLQPASRSRRPPSPWALEKKNRAILHALPPTLLLNNIAM
eukprot:3582031-Pyramimonas_sp.AAC.1